MNKLTADKRAQIVACLVEGNSIRSTVRLTGAAKNTVTKLLVGLGEVCKAYQDQTLRNLPCKRVQLDEIWSFVGMKQKNVPEEKRGELGYGDVWTWTSICADTKIVPAWRVGNRDGWTAMLFLDDLAKRLSNRVQLSTDGHHSYLEAVGFGFGWQVDYATIVKTFGLAPEGARRYSPPQVTGVRRNAIIGNPDPNHISTSFAERNHLNMRMGMRRMTRLTNAFSKKLANLEHAVALHYLHYNFVRIHQTLRTTPAQAAGVCDRAWEIRDIVDLLDRAN